MGAQIEPRTQVNNCRLSIACSVPNTSTSYYQIIVQSRNKPFSLEEFQPPSPLKLPADPVGPITMTSYLNPAPQNGTHAKEYGLNKPMPFSGNRTKIKAFLQECLVYINMNKEIYMTDRLKIGFVLLYMNEKEARDWQELYLESIEDPATGKLVYLTFGAFLTEVRKNIPVCGLSPRCIMQIGELETGQEDS